MKMKKLLIFMSVLLLFTALPWGVDRAGAQQARKSKDSPQQSIAKQKVITPAQRKAAADRFKQLYSAAVTVGATVLPPVVMDPGGIPHYFGPYANYANSPLPRGPISVITLTSGGLGYNSPVVTVTDFYGAGTGAEALASVTDGIITGIVVTNPGTGYAAPIVIIEDLTGTGAAATATIIPDPGTGIRKFVDPLPEIPIADPGTYSDGSDYYEIELGEFTQKMHTDLPPTTLRGYRQTNTSGPASAFHYMGPTIVAQRDRPVRIKFTNNLPTGAGGDLFLPVDTTIMGAGMGPNGGMEMYTENRATVHLHGNNTVWISDGTPHQWITPAGESTSYPEGVSVVHVPDMPDPGDGSMTLYYTNQQSARLMFYHDHAFGITRLNVYAGMAAPYLITDLVEQDLINGTNDSGVNPLGYKVLPDAGIPLVIQDKTFVDDATIAAQDPTWNWGTTPGTPNAGDLWYPHVYVPAQNPYDPTGANPFGRWHYGPWFWPTANLTHPPIPNPYYDPVNAPWEPPMMPDIPNPSAPGEAFMDTPVVNGMSYPYLEVEPKAYRLRILNAADDRFFNLMFFVADPAVTTSDGRINTEVRMVPATPTPGFPATWPKDGREGGVPDPATAGPPFIQIATESGFLPAPVVIPSQPVTWNMNQTTFNFGNVENHALLIGTAERADVIVDFSAFAGQTLILYNDAPAAFPALDPRYDYYTDDPDQTDSGGAPTTLAGYGPNTRTIMQIRVGTASPSPYNLAQLKTVFAATATKPGVFEASQDEIIVPQAAYNSAYDANFPDDAFVRQDDQFITFLPLYGLTEVTMPFEPKAIQDEMGEAFDLDYGRMMAMLGLELPNTQAGAQNFMLYPFLSPPVEIFKGITYGTPIGDPGDGTQIWRITHNGVDTHTIHTHLYSMQLINRVAWDGSILPPDPNELGWKETIRVNPLEHTIVAIRPFVPTGVPFDVPNSIRPIDPTKALGETLNAPLGGFKDPDGNPVPIIFNHLVNFGWEYVYHCHLLAHEEMDMMHSVAVAGTPEAPSGFAVTAQGTKATLTWTDNSVVETNFIIQRSTDPEFITDLWTFTLGPNMTTFIDDTIKNNQTYFYRVFASNLVGDFDTPGFPTVSANSEYSSTITLGTPETLPPTAPTLLTAAVQAGPQVLLSWTDNARNETGFVVERAIGAGSFATLAILGPRNATGSVNYADAAVTPGGSYTYQVKAINSAGSSAYSNTAGITVPLPPAAPSTLRATAERVGNGPNDRITLTWTDNSNSETGFTIQMATNATFTTGLVTSNVAANTTTFQTGNLPRNRSYYFRIRSFNNVGVSMWVASSPFPIITP
jgi:FtsP/CotA-like multicopper oxidase with cupredoxin domain